jgi:hypothetical protein
MARRPYRDDSRRQGGRSRTDMEPRRRTWVWWLFFMPGSVMMWFEFMFPKRGDVYASGRRYGNPLLQVVYTLVFYAVIALGIMQLIHAISPSGSAGNQIQSSAATGSPDNSASTGTASIQQSNIQAPPTASTADASNPENGNSQAPEIGQDLSMKLQALLAQAEQQFDVGQYQNAVATTEAILEIEPENLSAQRLHAASLRNLATVTAADATNAQAVSPSPSGTVAQADSFPPPGSYNPAIVEHRDSPYGRHVRSR